MRDPGNEVVLKLGGECARMEVDYTSMMAELEHLNDARICTLLTRIDLKSSSPGYINDENIPRLLRSTQSQGSINSLLPVRVVQQVFIPCQASFWWRMK